MPGTSSVLRCAASQLALGYCAHRQVLRCVPKCRDTLCPETGSRYGRPEMLLLDPAKMQIALDHSPATIP
jgi:hypothetical protein